MRNPRECCDQPRVVTVQVPGPQGPAGKTPEHVVLYTPQTPQTEEQLQAQINIGVAGDGAPNFLEVYEKAKGVNHA